MRSTALAAVVALAVVASAIAAPPGGIDLPCRCDTVVVPKMSPLVPLGVNDDNVRFSGKIELTGTFFYGDNEFNDTSGVDLAFYFRPDAGSLERLPAFRVRGRPDMIVITNGAAFARAVLTKSQRSRLTRKGATYASGNATIVVDRFEASIECDAPNFTARFVSVVRPDRIALTAAPDIGC